MTPTDTDARGAGPLPCAHCGHAHPTTTSAMGESWVTCPVCNHGTGLYATDALAIAAWNQRRAADPRAAPADVLSWRMFNLICKAWPNGKKPQDDNEARKIWRDIQNEIGYQKTVGAFLVDVADPRAAAGDEQLRLSVDTSVRLQAALFAMTKERDALRLHYEKVWSGQVADAVRQRDHWKARAIAAERPDARGEAEVERVAAWLKGYHPNPHGTTPDEAMAAARELLGAVGAAGRGEK